MPKARTKAKPNSLKNPREVAKYLTQKGYRISPATVYRHHNSRYILKNKKGVFLISAVERYAQKYLQKIGEPPKFNFDKQLVKKRDVDIDLKTAQARYWKGRAKSIDDRYIERELLESILAERAAGFKSDIENFVRSHASEGCHILEGNDLKIPDFINFWLEKSEIWLDRYARPV